MPSRYKEGNVVSVGPGYSVLREAAIRQNGSYAKEIEREIGINAGDASRILTVFLEDMDLVEKGKRTQAQYYELDDSGLFDLFVDLWKDRGLNFEAFLSAEAKNQGVSVEEVRDTWYNKVISYSEAYFEELEESTLEEMLVGDFHLALSIMEDVDGLNDDEKRLLGSMSKIREVKRPDRLL